MFCYVGRFVKMFSGFEVDRGTKKFHPRVSSGLRREKKIQLQVIFFLERTLVEFCRPNQKLSYDLDGY